jgi:hypothetical protein
MKLFKNNGWRYLSKMQEILPDVSVAQGTFTYSPVSAAMQNFTIISMGGGGSMGGDMSMDDDDAKYKISQILSHQAIYETIMTFTYIPHFRLSTTEMSLGCCQIGT